MLFSLMLISGCKMSLAELIPAQQVTTSTSHNQGYTRLQAFKLLNALSRNLLRSFYPRSYRVEGLGGAVGWSKGWVGGGLLVSDFIYDHKPRARLQKYFTFINYFCPSMTKATQAQLPYLHFLMEQKTRLHMLAAFTLRILRYWRRKSLRNGLGVIALQGL
jgi:hypothetical protein